MHLKNTWLAAALVAAPLSAHAQPASPPPVTGLYISLGAGANILMDEHLVNGTGTASSARLRSRIGRAVVGGKGYGLGTGTRRDSRGITATTDSPKGEALAFQ